MRRLDTNPGFPALFQFIGKNKAIPEFLAQPVEVLAPRLLALSAAIDAADAQAPIFSDPECSLLLLYLMQQERVKFWEGITVYVYLIALMQFTAKQDLAEKDQDIKRPQAITHAKLVENAELTQEGRNYVTDVQNQMQKKFGRAINPEALSQFVLSLPPFEQLVLRLNPEHISKSPADAARRLSGILVNNLPLSKSVASVLYDYYDVPGMLLLNYLLALVPSSGAPMQMLPVFGQARPETLSRLHQANVHPVSLYSSVIKSNPRDADGHRGGPFFMWLHDVGHSFWASMLTQQMRQTIFNEFVPQIETWRSLSEREGKSELATILGELPARAADFDLTPITEFSSREDSERLVRYLRKVLREVYALASQVEFLKAGTCPQDFVYFLLWREMCFQRQSNKKGFWISLAYSIETGYCRRSKREVEKLQNLAEQAVKNPGTLFGVFTPPRAPVVAPAPSTPCQEDDGLELVGDFFKKDDVFSSLFLIQKYKR